jgi:hypothetical protein
MTEIRIGFGSDFTLKNKKVGIGTTNPKALLDVSGAVKADFNIAGVATFASYSGFVAQKQNINKASTIGFGTVGVGTFQQYYETETGFTDLGGVHHGDDQYYNTLSEDLVIDEGQILNITSIDMVGFTTIGEYDPHSHQSHVCVGALEEVSVTNHFSVPNGGSNDRKDNPIEGTVRFNTDLNTLEFFNGNEWRQFTYNQGQSGRGVFAGGYDFTNPGQDHRSTIEFIQISTLGNTSNFGDLLAAKRLSSGCSSSTRGLNSGGLTPTMVDVIEYVTIASAGNSIDFGNLTVARYAVSAVSSSTRGINGGGYHPSYKNELDYVEIATIGNALDFGDLSDSPYHPVGFSNGTRGIFAGGEVPLSPGNIKTSSMDFITIASKGNGVKFGDLTYGVYGAGGGSNSVRGIYAGGHNNGDKDEINFVTIASEGNGVDFGNLTIARRSVAGSSSQTRTVIAGGNISPVKVNTIDYITIASSGNAFDFGDLSRLIEQQSAFSDSHGGLGGF